MEDKITELASIFKERDNPNPFQAGTGIVIKENPLTLKVEESIFLSGEYNNVIWSKSILSGYKRDFLIDPVVGVTDLRTGGSGESSYSAHDHPYKAPITGSIMWTDNPKLGDEYIVIPIHNGNMWYVFDKVVRP